MWGGGGLQFYLVRPKKAFQGRGHVSKILRGEKTTMLGML